jgi:hypothetical protein
MFENLRRILSNKLVLGLALFGLVLAAVASVLVYRLVRQNLTGGPPSGSTYLPLASGGSASVSQAVAVPAQELPVSIRLSEGQAQPQTLAPLPVATGEPLDSEQIEIILQRLPALPTQPADQADFRLAQQPIPPPRPGETIQQAFPPPAPPVAPPLVESGPLQVLRYSPEGEIPLAPFLSLTFNQPMVPLGTLEDLAARDVPVQIEPALPGTWRWLGAKTLTFEYDSELIDRLPKATAFRVTVPAGTKSVTGGVLEQAVSWTFTTPPPRVVASYPFGEPQPLDPLFFVAFDQRIDPPAVLETIRVTADGQPVAIKLASETDLEEDSRAASLRKDAQEGRWLAFLAAAPLPPAASISVTIGPGTPSAEGPLVTREAQSYAFSTYAPLRIDDHGCSWGDDVCRPLSPLFIRFNNPIDAAAYRDEMLIVEPQIPGAVVNIYGNTIQIQGATRGQTTYRVTVDAAIQDSFGQTLGKDETLAFRIGPAEAVLVGPDQGFVTLDPAASKPVFSVYAINHTRLDLEIYAVQPSDWTLYQNYLREWQRTDNPPGIPGRLVSDDPLRPELPADTLTQVDIDLSRYMDGRYGQFIIKVAPPKGLLENDQARWRRFSQTIHAWVQVTQIGLDAFADHSDLLVWASALGDGAPLNGVTITPNMGQAELITGPDGTARGPIPSGSSYLVARLGPDQAILPRSTYAWNSDTWSAWPPGDELRWYVFDDRAMYRPGEEVHLKGWLRKIGGGQTGDVGLLGASVSAVQYQITDPQGNQIGSGRAEVNLLGGFDFAFSLPQAVNLGYAYISMSAEGSLGWLGNFSYTHGFQIQEFRRPEFEVTARQESSGPYFGGDFATLAVEARYYAGDPLPGAEVTWQVTTAAGSYAPPNWPEFTFGVWQPWWRYSEYSESIPGAQAGKVETYSGQTDAAGLHYLRLDFDQSGTRPLSVIASATVMDVNRQAWGSTTSLLVHPASLYVGLRSQKYFVERGAPLKVDFIVTDIDGNPVADRPVLVRAARLEWKTRGGNWQEEEAGVQECRLGSTLEPVTCTFETPVGGSYRITATVADSQGRQNQSQISRWVSGGQRPVSRRVEQEDIDLVPDQETYQPGDVAQILVQSPFSPAEGLLTVSRSGFLYTERFRIADGTITLQVPVLEAHIPNLNIQVDLVGAAPRASDQGEPLDGVPPRPAYARGQLTLNIPPLQRTLALQATPAQAELEPGGETRLAVVVQDAAGQPVADAELAVVVVDEAILALTNYQLSDPLSIFYTQRPGGVDGVYGRSSIVLVDPLALAQAGAAAGETQDSMSRMAAGAPAPEMAMATQVVSAEAEEGAAQPEAIRVRTDFNPLATFAPQVRTGPDGAAQVAIRLPDNLTRYRVMVVAVDASGRMFGTVETSLTARLPLMVRPSPPRFLNFGDRFELPVVVQNQTDSPLEVSVVLRVSNLSLLDQPGSAAGRVVSVPAHDRVEVRFPATTLSAGAARYQVAAVSGDYADAANGELPVYTPATTEAFATYGVIDDDAVSQPVSAASGVFPQFGGLEISTSSTALQALTDAVLYLVAYPFECSEQLASRILAVAALRDVLSAFKAEGLPPPAELEAAVARDLARLEGMQNFDGGFPTWRRGFESNPFNTIHVAHALHRAASKGFSVPGEMQPRVLEYLRQIESYYRDWYGSHTRWTLSAYALYVRNLMGDRDPAKALKLIDEAGLDNLSMEALGWIWPVLTDAPQANERLEALRRLVFNRVVETAGAANFTTSYDDQTYLLLSSDRRTDAILLDALIGDQPQSDLIPKLVNGLLAGRTRGRWGNTQENVFVLLALDRYFNAYEAQTPDFVARLWLGEAYAGESEFRGRTTERFETIIPMAYLLDTLAETGGTQNLILSKAGPGRLYYRLGLRYAPTDLTLDPLDMGFVVQRRYEAVDDPADVSQDAQGVWRIRAGARVRVRITMVADNRRYHVALVDPLPAGLEIVNPALAVSQSPPPAQPASGGGWSWWWYWSWYEHQNLRDERAEAFTALLWDGVYEYSYIARATTPGTFVAPPAKAEEMYSPEVFGRSSSDIVIVE